MRETFRRFLELHGLPAPHCRSNHESCESDVGIDADERKRYSALLPGVYQLEPRTGALSRAATTYKYDSCVAAVRALIQMLSGSVLVRLPTSEERYVYVPADWSAWTAVSDAGYEPSVTPAQVSAEQSPVVQQIYDFQKALRLKGGNGSESVGERALLRRLERREKERDEACARLSAVEKERDEACARLAAVDAELEKAGYDDMLRAEPERCIESLAARRDDFQRSARELRTRAECAEVYVDAQRAASRALAAYDATNPTGAASAGEQSDADAPLVGQLVRERDRLRARAQRAEAVVEPMRKAIAAADHLCLAPVLDMGRHAPEYIEYVEAARVACRALAAYDVGVIRARASEREGRGKG